MKKLNELNNTLINEKIQELFESIIQIREKAECGNNFEFIKNVNYDSDIKQMLKTQYGKFLYC